MKTMPSTRKSSRTTKKSPKSAKSENVTESRGRRRCSPSDDLDSSDPESETEKQTTPTDNGNTNPSGRNRRSGRLQERSSRSFRLPSREEIWDKIPNTPLKRLSCDDVKPRRLVNNFTKENNRYNYDPAYTSGEESVEEFVVPDDEVEYEDSSSSSSSGEEGNEHSNSGVESSDASNSETEQKKGSHRRLRACQKKSRRRSSSSESSVSDSSNSTESRRSHRDTSIDKPKPVILYSESSDEGSPVTSPRKKLCKRQLWVENHSSDSEDTKQDNESTKKCSVRRARLRSKTRKKCPVKHVQESEEVSRVENVDINEDSVEMKGKDSAHRKQKAVIESTSGSECSTDNDIQLIDGRTRENSVTNTSDVGGMNCRSHNTDSTVRVVSQADRDNDQDKGTENKSPFFKALNSYLVKHQSNQSEQISDSDDIKQSDQSKNNHTVRVDSDKSSGSCDDSENTDHSGSTEQDSENDSENENDARTKSRRKERSCTKMNRSRQTLFSELRAARKSKLKK